MEGMTKVRVQDATKELSANTGRTLEIVSQLRRQSQGLLDGLRRTSDAFARAERERQEREAKEELRRQYEASAQFMTAYSSEQVPDVSSVGAAPAAAPAVPVMAP